MMCLAVSTNLPPIYLTTFGEDFGGAEGLSEEQLGRIPAILFAALMLGVLLTAPLADRWGGKVFVLVGLVLVGAGLTAVCLASSYGLLLAAAALLGLGGATLEMVLSPIVSALYPRQRASALNWLHSFYCIGAVCTVLIGSVALHFEIPWRAVVLGVGLLPTAVFLGFLRTAVPDLKRDEAERQARAGTAPRWFFPAALIAILLAGATEIGLVQWLPAYAERGLGYSKATGGIALAVFYVAMILARWSAASLTHRVRATSLMIGCCVATALLFAVAAFAPWAPVALAGCVAAGFAVGCLWPTTLAVTADRLPGGGATMFALMSASGNVGCTMMPWLIGLVASRTSLNAGLAFAGLCPIAMAIVLVFMAACRERTGDDGSASPR
jgi:fucose permease